MTALTSGLCSGAEKDKCQVEFGENLKWACEHCPKKTADDFSDYTLKLFYIRRLMKANYPFSANDLSREEWEDLGRIEEVLGG